MVSQNELMLTFTDCGCLYTTKKHGLNRPFQCFGGIGKHLAIIDKAKSPRVVSCLGLKLPASFQLRLDCFFLNCRFFRNKNQNYRIKYDIYLLPRPKTAEHMTASRRCKYTHFFLLSKTFLHFISHVYSF